MVFICKFIDNQISISFIEKVDGFFNPFLKIKGFNGAHNDEAIETRKLRYMISRKVGYFTKIGRHFLGTMC